jgi:hypothetical protein
VRIDLADRIRIGAEQREMSVNGLDRPELGVGDEPPFGLAICRRKSTSEDIGITKVLALIRLSAARKSPPVWRLTSLRCHFYAMHSGKSLFEREACTTLNLRRGFATKAVSRRLASGFAGAPA